MMVNSLPCDPEVARLVEENRGLVYMVMRQMGLGSLPQDMAEELAQEGMIGLFKAGKSYKPSKGKFSTHAVWWIKGALSHAVNLYSTQKRTPEKRTVSLEMPIYQSTADGETVRLADVLMSEADVEKEVFELNHLQLREMIEKSIIPHADMLLEKLDGKNQNQIAEERGVTRQCVSRQIINAREALAGKLRRMGYG